MLYLFKKITVLFILISFLTIVFFGFVIMAHGPSGNMQGDCPFSALGTSICPQNSIDLVFHHISAYQSFISAPVNFSPSYLIVWLILVASAFLGVSLLISPPELLSFFHTFRDPTPYTSHKRKILSWLTLFENSPAHL